MVKQQKKHSKKKGYSKGFKANAAKARKINASTVYETCTEQLSPFGGLLAVIKFLDLLKFNEIFDFTYQAPSRKPKMGHYLMVVGILMLLFIGFNRIWHFTYVRLDAMICGFFRLTRLPVASTFWRYVDSLGLNQAGSFLKIMSILRERFWQLSGLYHDRINISIDTTVETIYGNQQGGRKGHNTKNRGKKGYRPVLCFIDETREYLAGKLRKGVTIDGKECAAFIATVKTQLPGCVKHVLLRADGEFLSWLSVQAAIAAGFQFIIANKGCNPPFDTNGWYRPWKRKNIQFNSCTYKPIGWGTACRFVAMRIPKEEKKPSGQPVQCVLFEDDRYTYRIFCTSLTCKAHKVITRYDKRADVENLIGEAKREGLDAIPSGKFKNNYAFFQIVMMAYNIWRYMKIMAHQSIDKAGSQMQGIMTNTIRIARLKLLFIAAKAVKDGNLDKVKYSIHDTRTPAIMRFLKFIDRKRSKTRPWKEGSSWPYRFAIV
ncbi:MAG: transposase [Deltaproteobacteria bacterium]|nr:transposase [Deltaproteobacteria bacterium]